MPPTHAAPGDPGRKLTLAEAEAELATDPVLIERFAAQHHLEAEEAHQMILEIVPAVEYERYGAEGIMGHIRRCVAAWDQSREADDRCDDACLDARCEMSAGHDGRHQGTSGHVRMTWLDGGRVPELLDSATYAGDDQA